MIFLFSTAAFLSAALLFFVQPMIGKMLLPLLGGAPAVWNACMMFFQAALLLGYAYAHFSVRWIKVRRQALWHVLVLVLPLLVFPIRIMESTVSSLPSVGSPIPWLVICLTVSVGFPFFALAATAPLLQLWFSNTKHRDAHNPYFLYAASNAGSLIGLLGYPLVVEPMLRVMQQSHVWAVTYGFLIILLVGCVFAVWRATNDHAVIAIDIAPSAEIKHGPNPDITLRRKLWWILLAFVPSSLMLGITTYLATDVAPFPLLWVVPLALYLMTFILVFARRPFFGPSWLGRMLCLLTVVLLVTTIVEATHPAWLMILIHLLVFSAAALSCHGTLAKDRPPPEHLTVFYLCMSIGGVLGGIFNTLLAPIIFTTVVEYPLMMIVACSLCPVCHPTAKPGRWWNDFAWVTSIGLSTVALIVLVRMIGLTSSQVSTLIIFGVPSVLAYSQVRRRTRFGLSLGAILIASSCYTGMHGRTLLVERNFFGVLRVTMDSEEKYRQMIHGNTLHGRQSTDPSQLCEPLSYYYRTGPIGQVFQSILAATNATSKVAVIGLGAGSLVCYARPTQKWTFYEINPAVVEIAQNRNYFTFMQQEIASPLEVVLGDARLRLQSAADEQYDFIVVDAFSSDSIPIHLITQEALTLYLRKLSPNGVLAFHVTNRRLDLKPVIANLSADTNLVCLGRDDHDITDAERQSGKDFSQWIVITRKEEFVSSLLSDQRWHLLPANAADRLWTDDFSNILSVLRWE